MGVLSLVFSCEQVESSSLGRPDDPRFARGIEDCMIALVTVSGDGYL